MELPGFSATVSSQGYGRIGKLSFAQNELSTPILFPVVCLVTGTTARGGGLWKYILQADESNGLLRRNLPVMSQVLHFLDFIPNKPKSLEKWRKRGIQGSYREDLSLEYKAPFFLDSGGFKLLWNKSVNLSAYGLSIEDGKGPETILKLQRDFGASIIATLDYPLPPKLEASEAKERMDKSIKNAVMTALHLQKDADYKPFLYVAAHGQDRASMGYYVKQVFDEFQDKGLKNYPFGLAVGSLVPLRGAHKYSTIIEILMGLRDRLPEERKNKTPIHVFGVTGSLIPILAYLGIDSFDSSTYVQETRSLNYFDHQTGRSHPVLEMEESTCNCRVCRDNFNLRELQEGLTSEIRGRPLPNGKYKSEYYGKIALHNLEMDFGVVEETKKAIEVDLLQDYLIKHIEKFPKLRSALDVIAIEDDSLQVRLTRTLTSIPKEYKINRDERVISLRYTSEDFNILDKSDYYPPKNQRILLVIPCSSDKPYSKSRSHCLIAERLEQALGKKAKLVHKVTLSGLYGPVPEEWEDEPAIMEYDFRLEPFNGDQIALIANRLVNYLQRHRDRYIACIGYATSQAYRTALEQAQQQVSALLVLPIKPKTRRLTEFFRQENVAELVEEVKLALKDSK